MPYIKQEDRKEFDLTKIFPETPGELNFVITSIVRDYLYDVGVSYAEINEVIGVLECVKLELYRRIAVPYENRKILENGDVY